MIIASVGIDLSKIDKSKINYKGNQSWVTVEVFISDEIDKFGNNASISIPQSKEEREAKVPKVYLGNGRVVFVKGVMPALAPYIDKSKAAEAPKANYETQKPLPPSFVPANIGERDDLPF